MHISFNNDSCFDDYISSDDVGEQTPTADSSKRQRQPVNRRNNTANLAVRKKKKFSAYSKPRNAPPREVQEAALEFEQRSGVIGVSYELLHGRGAALRASGWSPQGVYERDQLCLMGYDTFLEYKQVPFKGKIIVFNRPRPERSWCSSDDRVRQYPTEVDPTKILLPFVSHFFTLQQSRPLICYESSELPLQQYKYYQKRRRYAYY